jgi:hypothetical protein
MKDGRMNKFNKEIIAGIAGLAIAAMAGGYYAAKKTDLFDTNFPVNVADGKREIELLVPHFNHIKVPSSRCSRYAVLAAEKMFGEHYNIGNAWDMKYENESVCKAGDLEKLAKEKILRPGMLVTWENQESDYAHGPDKTGNERNCNHVALYIGQEPRTNEPLFAEQRGDVVQVIDADQFKADGYFPVEVIEGEKGSRTDAEIRTAQDKLNF